MERRPSLPSLGRRQRGMATLLTVMGLLFVVSMVAAYASRNLVFEQRTSVNQLRATQAFEAAEAGVEWALGLLNGGRIDDHCAPTDDTAFDSFRARTLRLTAAGGFAPREWLDGGVAHPVSAACVRTASGWSCSCPSSGPPAPALPAGEGSFPAFLVAFELGAATGPLRLRATGCSAYDANCLASRRGTASDAAATVTATLGLASAMPTSPAAALTVRGDLDLGRYAPRLANPDPATDGVTVHAGVSVTMADDRLTTAAGSFGGARTVVQDPAVLGAWSADRMFASFFGVDRASFRRHPATVVVACGADCSEALAAAVARNPGRPIWIDGDLVVDQALSLGSAEQPVLLVVGGRVVFHAAGAQLTGIVYSQAAAWAAGGGGHVRGAVLAEGHLAGPSLPSIQFDRAVVDRVRLATGSMIRVPGGWRDF